MMFVIRNWDLLYTYQIIILEKRESKYLRYLIVYIPVSIKIVCIFLFMHFICWICMHFT